MLISSGSLRNDDSENVDNFTSRYYFLRYYTYLKKQVKEFEIVLKKSGHPP